MALSIEKTLDTGVKVSYFRISRVIVDRRRNYIIFDIDAFLDADAKSSGKLSVISYQYTLDDEETYNIINKMDIISALYGVIKGLSDFTGAVDV